jgi:alkanesulfonate monooxygenase SsuD/methylene tetrahydromethanopterin reductase-like flavin-dependent oxidoreductase (luciferase family)
LVRKLKFGIFDHLDRGGRPITELYDERLRIAGLYDRLGFHVYHLAEHHSTPLGMAPSPSLLLASIAQRTRRLRFGPLVYLLPLYHPLRLAEEIAMLDHLSEGRLEIGVGRGRSPIELMLYGQNVEEAQSVYEETLAVIELAFTRERLTFKGKHFAFDNVPIELRPRQRPHPPFWYGVTRPESAAWAAKNRINAVMNGPSARVKSVVDSYLKEWNSAHNGEPLATKLGTTRHIHVADSDAKAEEIARRAYAIWFDSNAELFRRYGTLPLHFPSTYDEAAAREMLVIGSPDTVRTKLHRIVSETGTNYVIGRFAFGDMPFDRVQQSVTLFAQEVMPAFRANAAV